MEEKRAALWHAFNALDGQNKGTGLKSQLKVQTVAVLCFSSRKLEFYVTIMRNVGCVRRFCTRKECLCCEKQTFHFTLLFVDLNIYVRFQNDFCCSVLPS